MGHQKLSNFLVNNVNNSGSIYILLSIYQLYCILLEIFSCTNLISALGKLTFFVLFVFF